MSRLRRCEGSKDHCRASRLIDLIVPPAVAAFSVNLENVGRRLREARFLHGGPQGQSCPRCHTPHGSDQSALLKSGYPAGNYADYVSERYDLCWQRHSKALAERKDALGATNLRQGEINLHRLHLAELGRGRACPLCHAAHASEQPHLLRERLVFKNWEAPLRFEPISDGGRCLTACHKVKEYRRK